VYSKDEGRSPSLRCAFFTRVLTVHVLSKMLARLDLLASCFVFFALHVYSKDEGRNASLRCAFYPHKNP